MGAMSHQAPPRTDEPPRRADSMLLLRDLVEGSIDEGYARAAARRRAGEPPPGRSRVLVLAVGLLAVGLLLATAYEQARSRAGSAAEARAELVTEVQQRAAENRRDQRALDRQRADVQRAQRRSLALTGEGVELAAQLDALEAATGAGAVVGPGMVVRLDDADRESEGADVDPRTGVADEGRVTDRDLQTVVNEVWAAGAEAVSVNRQRLTMLSAISAAGEAVLVDFRPLTPPYVVRAIGEPESMRERFVGGFGGSYLQVLEGYGITYSVTDDESVSLPASVGVGLRYAVVPGVDGRDTGGATGTGSPTAGDGSTPGSTDR